MNPQVQFEPRKQMKAAPRYCNGDEIFSVFQYSHLKVKREFRPLLLEIPSADHAYEGWLGGKAIREILDFYEIEHAHRLILAKRYLYRSIRKHLTYMMSYILNAILI